MKCVTCSWVTLTARQLKGKVAAGTSIGYFLTLEPEGERERERERELR
jgi:hypothetical protein